MAFARIFFDSLPAAAEGLLELLQHSRDNGKVQFKFGPTSAPSILESGLWMDGDIEPLADSIENKIPGSVRFYD